MSGRERIGLAHRFEVAGRVILAALGGYAVAGLSAAWLALVLPLARAEAVSAGTLASFAIMAAAIVWVFAARSFAGAALVLGLAAAILAGSLWYMGGFAPAGAA